MGPTIDGVMEPQTDPNRINPHPIAIILIPSIVRLLDWSQLGISIHGDACLLNPTYATLIAHDNKIGNAQPETRHFLYPSRRRPLRWNPCGICANSAMQPGLYVVRHSLYMGLEPIPQSHARWIILNFKCLRDHSDLHTPPYCINGWRAPVATTGPGVPTNPVESGAHD